MKILTNDNNHVICSCSNTFLITTALTTVSLAGAYYSPAIGSQIKSLAEYTVTFAKPIIVFGALLTSLYIGLKVYECIKWCINDSKNTTIQIVGLFAAVCVGLALYIFGLSSLAASTLYVLYSFLTKIFY